MRSDTFREMARPFSFYSTNITSYKCKFDELKTVKAEYPMYIAKKLAGILCYTKL